MTVSLASNVTTAVGDGSTDPVPIPFFFLEDGDIEVTVRTDATGAETTWVLNTDYTLTGTGVEAGGELTPITTRATGTTMFIRRVEQFTQGSDFPAAGAIPSNTIEQALDRLTFLAQQLDETLARALTVPVTDAASSLALPNATSRASKVLAFDSNGVPTVDNTDANAAAASAAAAAASAMAAAASAATASAATERVWSVDVFADESLVAASTSVRTIYAPYAMTLKAGTAGVKAFVVTPSTSGLPTVDMNVNGATILSTKLTIDANENHSDNAATPPVISGTAIAANDKITIDVDVAGTGTKGLTVLLVGTV